MCGEVFGVEIDIWGLVIDRGNLKFWGAMRLFRESVDIGEKVVWVEFWSI